MSSNYSMDNPIVADFIDEIKVTIGLSIVDDDLTDKDYLVLLRKSVREIGAYATEIRRDTLDIKNSVVDLKDLGGVSKVIAIYPATQGSDNLSSSDPTNASEGWYVASSLGANTDAVASQLYGANSLSSLMVAQYTLGATRPASNKYFQFDQHRQILLVPNYRLPKITIEYMKKISEVDYMITDPYWNTRLSELYRCNLLITLGTIYSKLEVTSSPYKLNTNMLDEGTRGKENFMERLREELFTFSPT